MRTGSHDNDKIGISAMQTQNTGLPVHTTSEIWPVYVIGMGAAPKVREKAAPTGEQTFSSQTIFMSREKDGADKPDKTASIHVIRPAATYELGVRYVSKGRVYVQPYTPDGGRSTLSITVEELIPVPRNAAANGEASK